MKVAEIMSYNVVTIPSSTSISDAKRIMEAHHYRRLPVVDKGKLVGIVTDRDIREAAPSDATTLSFYELNYLLENLKVSAFMTPREKVFTITPDTLLEEACQLLHDNKIGCLPILEGGKLFGLFTETDALEEFVEIFGLKQKGTRLNFALEDKPASILGVLEILKKHNVNVISIVSPSYKVEGKRLVTIRIRTESYDGIAKDLEKVGYPVVSIGKWLSKQ